MLANPYFILVAVLAFAGITSGAYIKGRSDGRAVEFSQRATSEELARTAYEAGIAGAASAIAQQKTIHTTIRQQAEVITRESKVYVECVNPDSLVRLLDAARENRAPEPASDSGMPRTGAGPAQDLW